MKIFLLIFSSSPPSKLKKEKKHSELIVTLISCRIPSTCSNNFLLLIKQMSLRFFRFLIYSPFCTKIVKNNVLTKYNFFFQFSKSLLLSTFTVRLISTLNHFDYSLALLFYLHALSSFQICTVLHTNKS